MALARAAACLFLAAALSGCSPSERARVVAGGDAERGRAVISRYGCVACHTIPGIPGHGSNVGPPLTQLGSRGYVAGVLPNTTDNLVRWLRDPPKVDPRTVMPDLGVSHAEALDIAAFLYAQD